MSTASFYVYEKSTLDELIAAYAEPKKSRSRKKDPVALFRNSHMTKLHSFGGSGLIFEYELTQLLKLHSIDRCDYLAKKATAKASVAVGFPFELFANPKSKELCTALDSILDDPKLERKIINLLSKYPKGEPRTHERMTHQAVFNALLLFRYWLSRIPPKSYGELFITY